MLKLTQQQLAQASQPPPQKQYKQEYYLLVGNKRVPLANRQTLIGRNPNATIFVDDHTIAKDHAIIELDENMSHPKLIDRGSVSGCTVNGSKVEKNGSQRLYQSDGIKFGNCKLARLMIYVRPS